MSLKILLIDDDELSLEALALTLRGRGYQVTTASDGGKGVDIFDAGEFDLVITDLVMPVKTGAEVITHVRGKNLDVKIIALSGASPGGGGPTAMLGMSKILGANETIHKPVIAHDLFAAIDRLLP